MKRKNRPTGPPSADSSLRAPDVLRARISAKVHIDSAGCWNWLGYVNKHGYGYFSVGDWPMAVYRAAYEAWVAPIPEGLTIDHLCRNRTCCNPEHLEPTTMGENTRRGTGPTARNAQATHCLRGHPYEGENLYTCPRGFRACRQCGPIYRDRYRARHLDRVRLRDRQAKRVCRIANKVEALLSSIEENQLGAP